MVAAAWPVSGTAAPERPKASAVVGALLWISLRTRPDIAWAVSRAASYVTTDSDLCHSRVKHIMQYLFGTFNQGLSYKPVSGNARRHRWSFADASFAPQGSRSHEGALVIHGSSPSAPTEHPELGGNLVYWKSGRQSFVTLSTAESELVALSNGVEATIPLALTLSELLRTTSDIHHSCDNSAAITMVRKGIESSFRTRHISLRAVWLTELLSGPLKLVYASTDVMLADSLTKGLSGVKYPEIRDKLRLAARH